jgi:hypothetical protein
MNHNSILNLLQTLQEQDDPSAPPEIKELENLCVSPMYNPDSPPYVAPSESEPSMKWTHKDSISKDIDLLVKTIDSLHKQVLYLTRVAHATNHCVRDMMDIVQKNMDNKENQEVFRL